MSGIESRKQYAAILKDVFIVANSSCKVATGRKTATVGVVGLRTDGRAYNITV
jgi:hypothetical protein